MVKACPLCKMPLEQNYLGWHSCPSCGWEEQHPTVLSDIGPAELSQLLNKQTGVYYNQPVSQAWNHLSKMEKEVLLERVNADERYAYQDWYSLPSSIRVKLASKISG